jgi:hypothetical protein
MAASTLLPTSSDYRRERKVVLVAEMSDIHAVLLRIWMAASCRQRTPPMATNPSCRPMQVCVRRRCLKRGTSRCRFDHLGRSASNVAQQTTSNILDHIVTRSRPFYLPYRQRDG